MIDTNLYYDLKPMIPAAVRMAVRRKLARRLLPKLDGIWPVFKGSERKPEGWTGWPDGKKFALVLTHDVEGTAGFQRCRKLLALERGLGVRSAYNFVPQGEYPDDPGLRAQLAAAGFEVGIHDLHHNGKLFRSRAGFSKQAEIINQHLAQWGACGFRAGFMLHNLPWLHDLNISYDCSTFDTDPFEPQPDSTRTIFPFHVPGPGGKSYVELPYTLPQDSTLFILLREQSPEIWIKKLDWIAEHGGMALLNVHPDYIRFDGEPASRNNYPAQHYADLIRHVFDRYAGQFWNPLPKEVAEWQRKTVPLPQAAGEAEVRGTFRGRAAIVSRAPYGSDPAVVREAETLGLAGMDVQVVCPSADCLPPATSLNGVAVHPIGAPWSGGSGLSNAFHQAAFIAKSGLLLAWQSFRGGFKLVRVQSPPGPLTLSAWGPKCRGAKIVTGLTEPAAEAPAQPGLLRNWMSRWSAAFSHLVVAPAEAVKSAWAAGGCAAHRIRVIDPNPSKAAASQPILECVDQVMDAPPPPAANGRRVCMVCYSYYETDNRVLRYAEELAKRGDSVEVLALRRGTDQPARERIKGVRVVRLQDRLSKNQKSKASYLLPIVTFSIRAFFHLARRQITAPYQLIHVHNVPDFLVFTALVNKMFGAKIILDIHDIVPEFYASKFNLAPDTLAVRALKRIEKAAANFSDHVIISNDLWKLKFTERTGAADKCSVFINNVNSELFRRTGPVAKNDRFIILFPGGLQWHQGVDIAIKALQKIAPKSPHAEFHIYGDGNMKESLVKLTHELGLDDKVRFFDPLPLRQIVNVMAAADLGVVPKRADSFGNEAYSTKIMEFMSVGVPVVISETKIDRHYFNDSVVRFFPSGDENALAAALQDMIDHPQARAEMAGRASDYAERNSWDRNKARYLSLVDDLCGRLGPTRARRLPAEVPSHAS